MKYLDECKRWTPEYYGHIYKEMLKEISEGINPSVPKWKRDLLLILLEESMRNPIQRKVLRKSVSKSVDDALTKVYLKTR